MSELFRLRATRVWLVLVGITVFGWALAEHGAPAPLAATSVMLIAALKIRFVVADFMELDWRPLPWRIVFELWTVAITLMILGGYWLTEL